MQTDLFSNASWRAPMADGTLPAIHPATEAVAQKLPAAIAPDAGGYTQPGNCRDLGCWGLDTYLEPKPITKPISTQPSGWYLKG